METVKDAVISAEIMKTIDERERCDTKCVVMRWSNSNVKVIVKDADN